MCKSALYSTVSNAGISAFTRSVLETIKYFSTEAISFSRPNTYYHCLKNWQMNKLQQLQLHYEVFMQNIGQKFQRLIYFHLLIKIQLCFNN